MAKAGPPPLKRSSSENTPPPRRPSSKKASPVGLAAGPSDAYSLELPADVMNASSSTNEDPTAGEWLFKDGDIIKGPVGASVLIEGIEGGSITESTLIGREVGQWQPLKEIPFFNRALDRAREKHIAEEELRAERQKRRTKNIIRAFVVVLFIIGPFLGGVYAGRILMKERPWDFSKEWVRRIPPLVDLPRQEKPVVVARAVPTPPVEDPAESADTNDEADDKDDKNDKRDGRRGRGKRDRKDSKKDTSSKSDKDNKDAKDNAKDAPAESGALAQTLTEDQVKAGLQKGFNGFKACIKTEFGRNTDLPPRITLAFSIANDGRAIEVKLLERQVRTGPLADCVKGVVSTLRWPKFYGERRYAEFPFNIGPKKGG